MKYSGYDVLLKVKQGAGYVTTAQVRDVAGPSLKQDTVQVTHRDGNKWREYLGGLRDGGEVQLDVVYDPDLQTHSASAAPGFVYLLNNGTLADWQMVFPDTTNTISQFFALVTGFEPTAPMEDALTAKITLKISGAPAWS